MANKQDEIMYTQGKEESYILDYFGDFVGTLADIGSNDGLCFSNSKRLIELGWNAVCVEPSPKAFAKLFDLHKDNKNVQCFDYAISDKEGYATWYEGSDALLSSLRPDNLRKWNQVQFTHMQIFCVPYAKLLKDSKVDYFDFITIDAEAKDWDILRQIDLSKTKLLCIEYGSYKQEIINYCAQYGLTKLIYQNGENLIIGR